MNPTQTPPPNQSQDKHYWRTSRVVFVVTAILTIVFLTTLFKLTIAEALQNMIIDPLETFVIEPSDAKSGTPPGAVVIWLHGLGASGHDFEEVIPLLKLPVHMRIRFVFPHAPVISVTVNNGMIMPAWYDIASIDIDRTIDIEGVARSSKQIVKLIKEQIAAGVPSERIIIAGFSQGGAVAYHTALSYPKKLAGLIALSTYLPTLDLIEKDRTTVNADLPTFVSHGTQDPVVPFQLGVSARDALINLEYPVEWHEYPIPHQMSFEQIEKVSAFIQNTLNQPRSRIRT